MFIVFCLTFYRLIKGYRTIFKTVCKSLVRPVARLRELLEAEMFSCHCRTVCKRSFIVTSHSCGSVGIMGKYLKWQLPAVLSTYMLSGKDMK